MPIKNISDIESTLKLESGTLKAAIEGDEEVEITIPELVIKTKEENERFMQNIDNDKKSRYDSGVEKGEKEAVLRVAKSLNIEIGDDKAKKIDNLLPLYKESIITESKIEPDKRIKSLETELETIRGNYKTLEGDFSSYKNTIETEKQGLKDDQEIMKSIPKENINYSVPEDDLLFLVKRKQKFGRVDGKLLALGEDGQPIKSGATLDPKPLKEIVSDLVKPYMLKPNGGTGDTDYNNNNSDPGSYEAFVKEMETNEIAIGTEKFQQEMQKRIQNKTLVL